MNNEILEQEVLTGKKILIADDDPVNQYVLNQMLKKFGIASDFVVNGVEAIEKLKQGQYDLILMDIQMPEMNGWEAARKIRSDLHSNIPIIAITAFVAADAAIMIGEAGMNDFISKPFTIDVLRMTITKALLK